MESHGGVWKGRRGLRKLLFACGLGDIGALWGQSASRTVPAAGTGGFLAACKSSKLYFP